MFVNLDRMEFMHSPEVLYKLGGFQNLDKLKEYGNLHGTSYTGVNIYEAYEILFNDKLQVQVKRRENFFQILLSLLFYLLILKSEILGSY